MTTTELSQDRKVMTGNLSPQGTGALAQSKKTRLLVITQDDDVKKLIDTLILHDRIQAAVIDTPLAASHFLKNNPLPDILVLDLTVSETESVEFLRQMRVRSKYAALPVLVLTDIPDPTLVREALQAGADRYLTKLFVSKNLLSTLDDMRAQPR